MVAALVITSTMCVPATPGQAAGQARTAQSHVKKSAASPKAAPGFTAADIDGKPRTLKDLRGKPVTLFFFCGCEWCRRFAKAWAEIDRSGGLPTAEAEQNRNADNPRTVVVFMGDADNVRAFVEDTGLDASRTVPIPDPRMDVTMKYKAVECPRIFVLDREGRIRYTNNHKDDQPRKAAAATLVSKTIDALRAVNTIKASGKTTSQPQKKASRP